MMKTSRLTLLCLGIAAAASLPASAEVFTVKMTNQTSFITRYQPQQDPRDEGKISLLTEFGNWVSIHKAQIDEITSETESRGFGTVLDTHTIVIGWAPNDKPEEAAPSNDPTSKLLDYMRSRDSASEQDFSVQQFVSSDDAGVGGLPARDVSSSGSSSFPVAVGGTIANEPAVIDQ
jgi:hypothetical protein